MELTGRYIQVGDKVIEKIALSPISMLKNELVDPLKIDLTKIVSKKKRINPLVGIYMIKYKDKIYIGQSLDVENRFSKCYKSLNCKRQILLYRSLKKYGIENHEFFIVHRIEKLDLSKEELRNELNKLETHYVKVFNSFVDDNPENGLNLTRAGDCREMSDQTKKRIGDRHRGKITSVEARKKQSEAKKGSNHHNFGKHLSEETKKRQSEKAKMREKRYGEKNNFFGKKHTDETKKLWSQSRTGKKQSPETIEKRSSKLRGRPSKFKGTNRSLKDREAISKGQIGRVLSEETKRKMRKPKSQEARLNIKLGRIKYWKDIMQERLTMVF